MSEQLGAEGCLGSCNDVCGNVRQRLLLHCKHICASSSEASVSSTACRTYQETSQAKAAESTSELPLSRRAVMSASLASAALALLTDMPANAVQGYTAGRIPGSWHVPACTLQSSKVQQYDSLAS